MTNQTLQNTTDQGQAPSNSPDHVAIQYRVVTREDGFSTRRERIGVAWNTGKGICFRPTGKQIIEGDVYLYPFSSEPELDI